VRFSSVAKIPCSVLSCLIKRHPRVLANLSEHVCERAFATSGLPVYPTPKTPIPSDGLIRRGAVSSDDAKTVLVLPV
jgi:hypothetical protein